jgi:hypothetical protein
VELSNFRAESSEKEMRFIASMTGTLIVEGLISTFFSANVRRQDQGVLGAVGCLLS